MPGYGQCVAGASHCCGLRALPPCAAARRGFPGPLAPAHPGSPPTRDRPASPLPPPPFPPEPPFLRAPLSSHASGGTGSKNGPFHWAVFLGGSGDRILLAAVTLRDSAVGAGPVEAAGYARHPCACRGGSTRLARPAMLRLPRLSGLTHLWQPRRCASTAATRHGHGLTLAERASHAIPAPEPTCHTALSGDTTRRACGRPCMRCQSLPLGGSRPHPDRYGPRRSFTAAASCRPAHRPPRRKLLACRSRSPPLSKNVVGTVGAHLDFSAGIPATLPRGMKKLVRNDPHPEVDPTGSQPRRSFAALQRRAPRRLTPRPRRPVDRTTGLGVAAGARFASLCPSLYGHRLAFRSGITDGELAGQQSGQSRALCPACRPARSTPASPFRLVAAGRPAPRLPRMTPTRRRVLRTPYRNPEPACPTAFRG